MTPEQEYDQAVREVTTIRSQYDASKGAFEATLKSITDIYPEAATLADAEAVLASLRQQEAEKREHFLARLAEHRRRFPATNRPAN
jgi:hypothetical protein